MSAVTLFLITIFNIVHSDITVARFQEFRTQIRELVNCNIFVEKDECKGLVTAHPDVIIHDIAETIGGLSSKGNLAAALVRLSYHDCIAIDPDIVAEGDNEPFTDPEENGFSGGCNGCIGLDNPRNDILFDAAIEPIQPICDEYMEQDGLTRADCWALAGTVAAEWASEQLFTHLNFFGLTIDPALMKGDIPYYIGRKDCENEFEDGEVEYEFSNPKGVQFEFPDALQGWTHVSEFFKARLSWNNEEFTNRNIIALISGGHSIGRAHAKVSGYSGAWDFTPQTLDGEWISILFNEDYGFLTSAGPVVQNLNQTFRTNLPNRLPQWSMEQHPDELALFPVLATLDPPLTAWVMNFNTDISMVYDISHYIENGLQQSIDCHTNAAGICDEGLVVLTAMRGESSLFNQGKTSEELGEQYVCGVDEECCEHIQCPIQCEGGMVRYDELINGDLDSLTDDVNCPAALAKRYSNKLSTDWVKTNRDLGMDFAKAFTKMITVGYTDDDGELLLKVIGQYDASDSDDSDDSSGSDSEDDESYMYYFAKRIVNGIGYDTKSLGDDETYGVLIDFSEQTLLFLWGVTIILILTCGLWYLMKYRQGSKN